MKLIHVILLLIVVLFSGCSIPDPWRMDDLQGAIEELPEEQQATLEMNKENDTFAIHLDNFSQGHALMTARCKEDPSTTGVATSGRLKTALKTFPNWGFVEVVEFIHSSAQAQLQDMRTRFGKTGPCTVEETWEPSGLDVLDDVREQVEQQKGPKGTARWLVQLQDIATRPEVMGIVGLITVGGVAMYIGGALGSIGALVCVMSDTVYCPDDPGAPAIPQHPATPGGER